MMIGRVTSSGMVSDTLRNLQSNLATRAQLQEKATSNRAFSAPSEDPTAAAATLSIHGQQARVAQFTRNISDGMAWVTQADSALASSITLLNRARDLTVQGGNADAMSQPARDALAQEIEGLSEALLNQANATVGGRTIFAGTSDAGKAFDETTYTWTGTPGSEVTRRVGENELVRVDVDGGAAFGEGAGSVFALLKDIAGELRAGTGVNARLGDIDDRLKSLVSAQSSIGTYQAQIERASEVNLSLGIDLEARRADVENIDQYEVLIQLQAAELTYQSALQVASKSLSTNLMEFIR